MSLLPRLLLARHLSRRAIQVQLQACIGDVTPPSSEFLKIGVAEGQAAVIKVRADECPLICSDLAAENFRSAGPRQALITYVSGFLLHVNLL